MEEQINKPLHIILVSIAMVIPSIARAQTATAFDGTYAGVSNTANGGGSSCNPFNPTPRPLTVLDGHAQFTGGSFASGDVVFEGNLSPQGDINMWDMFTHHLIGKIDPSGKATGSVSVGDTSCVLTAVWQRQ